MLVPQTIRVLRSALVTWLVGWYNCVPVCVLWVLCWLTVILGPPATFALVFSANTSVHGVYPPISALAAEGKRYFWLSWAWTLANLLVGGLLWGCLRILPHGPAAAWVIGIAAFAWLVVQFFALPCLIIQDRKNLLLGLWNGTRMALAAPVFTLVVSAAGLLAAAFSLVLVAPLALGGPSLVAVLANQAVLERLKTFELLDE